MFSKISRDFRYNAEHAFISYMLAKKEHWYHREINLKHKWGFKKKMEEMKAFVYVNNPQMGMFTVAKYDKE